MNKLIEEFDPLERHVFYVSGYGHKRQKISCYGRGKDAAYQKIRRIYPDLIITYEGIG